MAAQASVWQERDGALERTFELPSFADAIRFVNRVAEVAERLAELAESEDHHPDIDIRYRRVTVRWTTHSEGGITERDRRLAVETDSLT